MMSEYKKNVAIINIIDVGSTGKIMHGIAENARLSNFSVITVSSFWHGLKKKKKIQDCLNHYYFNSFFSNILHYLLARICGLSGFGTIISTLRLLKFLKKNNVQLIHLHILHGSYINIPLLFHFIKRNNISVVWTLHDCWNFTGRCPHFVLAKCTKWKTGCCCCPYPKNRYPQSFLDTTRMMWMYKQKWFTGIQNCILVTPSQWLADLVKQSFLKDYPIKVINNGIDLSIFRPTESDFRNRYGLVGKKVVLGVAFGWGYAKGLDVFIELSKRLPENYQIVLVGTNTRVDSLIPANIISVHRTYNQSELAEIYTAADVFANPTREEVLGLVNVESLACGTPVVTFRTGGSPECIDETCGSVVDCDDVDTMESEICRICDEKPYSMEACIARSKKFDMNDRFEEYVKLYKISGGFL